MIELTARLFANVQKENSLAVYENDSFVNLRIQYYC